MTPPDDPKSRPAYDGGIEAVLNQMEARRDPLKFASGEALPAVDVDLAPLKATLVIHPDEDPAEPPITRSSYGRKRRDLRIEFTGEPELCCLNGLLIAALRRRSAPEGCADLFIRLWAEQSEFLIAHLNPRWLVSSVTTFADHGGSEAQRRVGHSLTLLFGMMKLYETERLFSGVPADRPFTWRNRAAGPLPMEMDNFSIPTGGLDVNMLGRLWQDAGEDAVIAPLARHLIEALIHDPRTIFKRLRTMRHRKARKRLAAEGPAEIAPDIVVVPPSRVVTEPDALRWGVVATVRAPAAQIAAFAAHHIDLGAARVNLFLDAPDPEAAAYLASHPAIDVTTCDDAYWDAQKKPRMEQHQMRQAFNASRAYSRTDVDWLAHLDVDEFLWAGLPVAEALAAVPPDAACLHMDSAEQLAGEDARGTPYFKLSHTTAGQEKAVLETIYPTFGAFVRGGFVSHLIGKTFTRTGLDRVRIGFHTAKTAGAPVANQAEDPRLRVLHCHAPSWATFRDHMAFRLAHGSYRKRATADLAFQDIIEFLQENEGEAGLQLLFDEVCAASPRLVDGLRAHDMLMEHDLDLDAKVVRVFGAPPPGGAT